tara:strand:+ start:3101 stop:4273 length:1173 start_codon:yes stop_codon:yes gene_type:complete
MIPYGKQTIDNTDIKSVVKVLKSDYLTQGPIVNIFEKKFSEYTNSKHAIASNSATSSLILACRALGVSKGDWVWTSAITFVASSNCAIHCGANVDLVDISLKDYNICVNDLERKLKIAKKKGILPKVVIPVHLSGNPCDLKKINKLSKKYGFKIIEDASHAIGSIYQKSKIGSCKYSDITVFSFHPVKIMTTGEGGMCTTNDLDLYNKIKRLSSHGVTRDPNEMTEVPHGPWYYQQIDLGYNFRMTEIRAALGLNQLKKINKFTKKRNQIASKYDKLLKRLPIYTPQISNNNYSSFHLYIIRINEKNLYSRNKIFEHLLSQSIFVNLHYIPIYKHPYYKKKYKFKLSDFPNSELYYKQAISLPIFPNLLNSDQKKIVNVIKEPIGHQTIF